MTLLMTVLTASAPYRPTRASILPAVTVLAEMAARRSICTTPGSRDWRRNTCSRSVRTRPASTIRSGGNADGSVKMSGASTQKLPTTEPPMSEWCRTLATQQNSCSPANTGAATMVSGWCGVPTYGSLDRNMSPGPMPGEALRFSRIHLIVSDCALEKYCR